MRKNRSAQLDRHKQQWLLCTIKLLDHQHEAKHLFIPPLGERVHIIVEVRDIEEARSQLSLQTPEMRRISWGAASFLDARSRWNADHFPSVDRRKIASRAIDQAVCNEDRSRYEVFSGRDESNRFWRFYGFKA